MSASSLDLIIRGHQELGSLEELFHKLVSNYEKDIIWAKSNNFFFVKF